MRRSFYLLSIFLVFAVSTVNAQNFQGTERLPGIGRQALNVDVNARIIEGGQRIVWNESNSKITIPGNPVGIQLVGSNIVVVAQFTPFIRPDGNVLVAQGQIWLVEEDNTVNYYTSIQTIPMEYGEQIFFFPLGSSQNLSPSIEIIVTVNPYNDGTNPRGSNANRSGGR